MFSETRGDAQTCVLPELLCNMRYARRKEHYVQFGTLVCLDRRVFGTDEVLNESDVCRCSRKRGPGEDKRSTLVRNLLGWTQETLLPVHPEPTFADIGKLNEIRSSQDDHWFQTHFLNSQMYEESWISGDHRVHDAFFSLFITNIVLPRWQRDGDGMRGERWDREPKGFAFDSSSSDHDREADSPKGE